MSRLRVVLLAAAVSTIGVSTAARGQEFWTISGGATTIELDKQALERLGLHVGLVDDDGVTATSTEFSMAVDAASDLIFTTGRDADVVVLGGVVRHVGRVIFKTAAGAHEIANPGLSQLPGDDFTPAWQFGGRGDEAGLTLGRTKIGFRSLSQTWVLHSPDLLISRELAALLGDPSLAGAGIGRLTTEGWSRWAGGEEPDFRPPPGGSGGTRDENGPDMVFCQLFALGQYGRLNDTVGLAVATTSWNIGNRDMRWFASPNALHPFIVMNLYRIKSDRFEHIGQSSIKHGFYALGNTQCGGTCTYEPGHGQGNWLGQGCTDTYSAALNASQNGLAPRSEVNGWTGAWTYAGSHFSQGNHAHNAIEHRLQVRDADLNPPQNPGATYYCEGYYLTTDDINPMNSAAWKPVTVSGSPGGTWSFGMTGASTLPVSGFAINAWTGATQTVLAQEVPPVRFQSPDGRCVLAAKATNVVGNLWHYEYALLNVDMHRKVREFSIPIAPWTGATNIGFSAVRSHDEPYSNAPWTVTVSSSAITWSTTANPLRWANVYNFRFDAQAEPVSNATVTLGLHEPGTPSTISGVTIGPDVTLVGDAIRGGLLWDKWWRVTGAAAPGGNHPLYPPAGQQSGSDTYRCKECHGWDYKGRDGAYATGPHHTGIRGVYGSTMSPQDMFDIIKSASAPNGHGFAGTLSDTDIRDLVQFIQTRVIDTEPYVTPGGEFLGDLAQGQTNYYTGGFISCVACHGADGATINFGTADDPEWIGTIAVEDPWKLLHKIRFGQPGLSFMGSWLAWGGTDQGAADIGVFSQQTMPVDCLDNSYCADVGDPCNRIRMCAGGRCVPSTLDGDLNLDSIADGEDIPLFVQAIIAGSADPNILAHADFSGNGLIDADDVACMVSTLLSP